MILTETELHHQFLQHQLPQPMGAELCRKPPPSTESNRKVDEGTMEDRSKEPSKSSGASVDDQSKSPNAKGGAQKDANQHEIILKERGNLHHVLLSYIVYFYLSVMSENFSVLVFCMY